jgi:hypothetical protein
MHDEVYAMKAMKSAGRQWFITIALALTLMDRLKSLTVRVWQFGKLENEEEGVMCSPTNRVIILIGDSQAADKSAKDSAVEKIA